MTNIPSPLENAHTYQEACEIRKTFPHVERIGLHDTFTVTWLPFLRRDGRLGKEHSVCGPLYTPLFECDVCGIVGSPRKVCRRNDVYGWFVTDPSLEYSNSMVFKEFNGMPLNMLCTGCWNKVKKFVVFHSEYRSGPHPLDSKS